MKVNMKKAMIAILIVSQLFFFTSCLGQAFAYVESDQVEAFTLASYNIPGASYGYGLHVEMIEEDSYGRKMFRLSCLSQSGDFYSDGYDEEERINIRAYLISQKGTKKGVYYLDSVCYMIRLSWEDFSTELLDEFKALNDWEKELDSDRFSYRAFPSKLNGIKVDPLFAEVNYAYKQHTGKDANDDNVSIQYVCNDSNGKCLAYIRVHDENTADGEIKSYVFIVSPQKNGEESYCARELSDFYQQNEDVIAIKEDADWISPKE